MQNTERLGKYKIIEEIGRGGFGIVYKAEDTTLDRTIALKVLAPYLCGDPAFIQRFHREAKAIARLRHPHIVTVHEIGEQDGQVYMAMEYIPGQTLTKLLEDVGSLSPEQIACILEQLAGALDYAHSQGLLHRDIKPDNIMVEMDNRNQIHTTLMDFGLVKIIESSQYVRSTMAVMGTPEYMSPEQAEGQELDPRSDLYALGIVAYQMCTGQVPFRATSPLVVMRFHVDKDPPPPRELNPELPEEVEFVLLKALHKQPGERYQCAADLVTAFKQAFISGKGLSVESDNSVTDGEHQEPTLSPKPKPTGAVISSRSPQKKAPPSKTITPSQSFEPELILIPAGEFLMGSDPEKDSHAGDSEKPQHTVFLPDYYIAKTPVTNAQYRAFVEATGHKSPKHWKDGRIPSGKENHPVVYVSWRDAVTYCRWLAEVTEKPYRLPTEAEWEKAARGTDGRIYPWGDEWGKAKANIDEDKAFLRVLRTSSSSLTTPVGKYSPRGDSPYGCVDMAGNVWEWTSSLYKNYPYCADDGRENMDVEGRRVLRGGAVYDNSWDARCAYRNYRSPNHLFYNVIGFRVAAAAETEREKTEFDVVLKDAGPMRIGVIKVIRQLTNLGLKEAKDTVEAAPINIMEAVSRETAEYAKRNLEAAGAVVEIKIK